MSDHIDGPRQIGDPASDLTDLFVFTSPENAGRTVLVADVFPSAGTSAMFSNVVNHSLVVRRVTVAGLGDGAKFQSSDPEYRFSCRFDTLQPGADGKPIQRGTCTCPDGQVLHFVVNDEKGASSPDKLFRVFAGLRSDPFFLAWLGQRKVPNILQHDNVLSIVIEFDTQHVLDPSKGSLFGAIAETAPLPQPGLLAVGHDPPRFDWVGKPEQTNMRLNNFLLPGTEDLRDLWNQQTPFAIAEEHKPLFRKRLIESLAAWDMSDGKADWTQASLAASAEVFLDDFMLFDVTKPITDSSHLEIEKSTLDGHAYHTGGGRTINSNCFDILKSWVISRDRELIEGDPRFANPPSLSVFPYMAPPNTQPQIVIENVDLAAPPEKVWALIGNFDNTWHPLIAKVQLIGTGVGQLRQIDTIDGKRISERLEAKHDSQRLYRYTTVSGIPAVDCAGVLDVKAKGGGSSVEWRVQYLADGAPDIVVKTVITTLLKTGLESLKKRFG